MLKFITCIPALVLDQIYKDCGELYNSGLDVKITELCRESEDLKEHGLKLVALGFKSTHPADLKEDEVLSLYEDKIERVFTQLSFNPQTRELSVINLAKNQIIHKAFPIVFKAH